MRQETCIQLDNGDVLRKADTDLSISNIWTVATWIKGSNTSSTFKVFIGDDALPNTFELSCVTQEGGVVNLKLRDRNNVVFYQAAHAGDLNPVSWHHLVLSWDGFLNTLLLFVDGIEIPVFSLTTNNIPAVMNPSLRSVGIQAFSNNIRFYSLALWDVALNGFDVQKIYNEGNAADIDLSSNFLGYERAFNLRHWWRLGFEPGNIGRDFGFTYNRVDLMTDALGMDPTDFSNIISDFPGA